MNAQTTLADSISEAIKDGGSVVFLRTTNDLPFTAKVNLRPYDGSNCATAMQCAMKPDTVITPKSATGVERLLGSYDFIAFTTDPTGNTRLGCGVRLEEGWRRDYQGSDVDAVIAAARWGQRKDAVRAYISGFLTKVRGH